MAASIFTMCAINFKSQSKLESDISAISANKLEVVEMQKVVKSALLKIEFGLKKLCDDDQIMLKNEISKINLSVNGFEQKVINIIKNYNSSENAKQCIIGDEINNKMENLLEIVERIYDYSAMNENMRVNDNYNYYNLVRNEVITYFESKINQIISDKN